MRNAPRNKAMGPPIIDRERSESESDELMLVDYNPHAKRRKVKDVQAGATVLFNMMVEHNQFARAWNDGVECFFAFVQSHHSGLKNYSFDKTKLDIPLAHTVISEKTVVLISPSLSFIDPAEDRPVIPSPVMPSSPEDGEVLPSSPEDNVIIPSPVLPSSPNMVIPSPVLPSSPEDNWVAPSPVLPSSPESA
jgi:hypothetical protein